MDKKHDGDDVEAPPDDAPRAKGGARRGDAQLTASAHKKPAAPHVPPRTPPHGLPPSALASAARTPGQSRRTLLALAAFATLALLALHRFGAAVAAQFHPEALRATFEAAGAVGGVALYVAAFCVGELLHLPGTLFVAAGVLVWGCVRAGCECAAQRHTRSDKARRSPSGS
jgi:hypothetical protein